MKNALRQTLILWLSLLLVSGLGFLLLQLPAARDWLWNHTGEEELLAQVKGLSDLASDRLRPAVTLAADAAIADVAVSPFGINVFLEQEAEPAKRAQAVEMAAAAGYHWLRQEFPWE